MRTPVFSSGIAALRRRNPDRRMARVRSYILAIFSGTSQSAVEFLIPIRWIREAVESKLVIGTVRSYLYPVHRTPTDDPIYGEGMGLGEGRKIGDRRINQLEVEISH